MFLNSATLQIAASNDVIGSFLLNFRLGSRYLCIFVVWTRTVLVYYNFHFNSFQFRKIYHHILKSNHSFQRRLSIDLCQNRLFFGSVQSQERKVRTVLSNFVISCVFNFSMFELIPNQHFWIFKKIVLNFFEIVEIVKNCVF